MSEPKHWNIFISSKMIELREEREVLFDLLPKLSRDGIALHGWVFEEDAHASEKTIREVYLEALHDAVLYIGLFWNEYGKQTIDEFERATEWGLDRHIYVKDVDAEKRDPLLTDFLNRHQTVTSGTTHKWFKTTEQLIAAVERSIQKWLEEKLRHRPGSLSAIHARYPDDIPHRPRRLIGRDDLVAEIMRILELGDRVLLQGFGGMGKTALGSEIAANWIEGGKGAVLWQKAGSESHEAFFEALARPFGLSKDVAAAIGEDKTRLIRDMLTRSGATLFVIDDAWDGRTLQAILKAIPRSIGVVVSSRHSYPIDAIVHVGTLAPDEALEMLGFYARQDYGSDAQAPELCDLLGNHAFAIEIAGTMLKVDRMQPEKLYDLLKDEPYKITMPFDFADEGRESFVQLLEASLTALEDSHSREVFMAFGALFSGSATPELLTLYFENASTNPGAAAIDQALTELMRRGLADRTDGATPYYHIHDLAYSYAKAHATTEERGWALEACLAYTGRYNEPSVENFTALHPELENFMGAAAYAMSCERWSDVERFAVSLYGAQGGHFLDMQGFYRHAVSLLLQAISAAKQQEKAKEHGQYLGNLGSAFANQGQIEKSIDFYDQALAIARQIEDQDNEGKHLSNLANALIDLGQFESAIQCTNEALAIARESKDFRSEGSRLGTLGSIYYSLDKMDLAIEFYEQALAISRESQDLRSVGNHLGNLGNAYSDLGQDTKASEYYLQQLTIVREIGYKMGEGNCLNNLGVIEEETRQNYPAALAYYEQALAIYREIGAAHLIEKARNNIADVKRKMAETDQ